MTRCSRVWLRDGKWGGGVLCRVRSGEGAVFTRCVCGEGAVFTRRICVAKVRCLCGVCARRCGVYAVCLCGAILF